ncbi:Kelch repeat and BTB domain-containing protein 4 [Tolypocladium ophioglossoides CBS 100239]|uniref:Kelch repeat and BTB domain-containing protein 4 n=1 Tax=Tolypocladium ophioglossoides (strain CBS 100239) TaxID=1163406 RepID=A0A0L0N5D5_TOLOC|nr:Kelch repeat and BTB domain-containing protein 4 [Tolypocladium ophioglossoides CBS 100239]
MYFNQETYSDAVVRCNEQQFRVHRLVLSAHSEFFATMFSGAWKLQKEESLVELKEVDESVVEAMLRFMYHFDYSNINGASTMIFNAQVYGIAERYIIPSLKEHSAEKFRTAVSSGWNMGDFPLAIAEAYLSTPEGDRGLRDVVVEVCHMHIDSLIENHAFCQVLRETVGFAADMVIFRCGQRKAYRCPSCSHLIHDDISKGSYHCTKCGERRSNWVSYKFDE